MRDPAVMDPHHLQGVPAQAAAAKGYLLGTNVAAAPRRGV